MFTDAGDLCILNFEHVAFLPISSQEFAFRSPFMMSSLVAPRIQDQFDLPQNNFMVMERVPGLMHMSGSKLGELRD